MTKKRVLRVLFANGVEQSYLDFLNKKFIVEVLEYESMSTHPDLILFTGGADINPDFYSEKLGKYTNICKERDKRDQRIYNNFIGGSPMLGICRGAQFLTAMSGGRIIQHVENHTKDHYIKTRECNRYVMTSTHHQMMYPYELKDTQYEIIAHSLKFQSPTYLNGNNEEIDVPKDFLEPEIIYYRSNNSLCIQGHPEFSNAESDTVEYSLDLIESLVEGKFKQTKEELVETY